MNVSHWFTLFRVANVGLKCLLRDLQWPESLTSPAITAPQRQPKIHFEEAYGIIWVLSENYCFQNGHSWSISNCVSFIGFTVQILPLNSSIFRSLKVDSFLNLISMFNGPFLCFLARLLIFSYVHQNENILCSECRYEVYPTNVQCVDCTRLT